MIAAPRVALLLGALVGFAVVASIPLAALNHDLFASGIEPIAIVGPFAAVGVVVARRQPHNPIGWAMLGLALSLSVSGAAGEYALVRYTDGYGGLPLGRLAVALAGVWILFLLLLPVPLALFPDGRVRSSWLRWTLRLYAVVAALEFGAWALQDAHAFADRTLSLDSTGELAVLGGSGGVVGIVEKAGFVTFFVLVPAWVVGQVLAFRRARGERRQQYRWLLLGGGTAVVGFLLALLFSHTGSALLDGIGQAGFACIAALPVGIGVGILKYRLYEIDRLISRTLSYAIVTGLLVGVFVAIVALTTEVLPFSSPVGVAASTLAAAALFNPLRGRVQRLVDRRFNRARYDREATVAAFAQRLRDAVDVESVQRGLTDAVLHAVEPAHATVWLRSVE